MSNDNIRFGMVGASPISVGRFTYGFENINIRQWNEGAALNIGSFCSLAKNITIFLGGITELIGLLLILLDMYTKMSLEMKNF